MHKKNYYQGIELVFGELGKVIFGMLQSIVSWMDFIARIFAVRSKWLWLLHFELYL